WATASNGGAWRFRWTSLATNRQLLPQHAFPLRRPCMPMRPKTSRRTAGLSLVETLLASAVLSFSTGAVLYAVVTGQAHYAEAENRTHAIELADDLMAEITALPYLDPDGPSNPGP